MEHFHFAAPTPEPEKPKGPTEADVQRLADEIKSLARPPTMTEARDLAATILEEVFLIFLGQIGVNMGLKWQRVIHLRRSSLCR